MSKFCFRADHRRSNDVRHARDAAMRSDATVMARRTRQRLRASSIFASIKAVTPHAGRRATLAAAIKSP